MEVFSLIAGGFIGSFLYFLVLRLPRNDLSIKIENKDLYFYLPIISYFKKSSFSEIRVSIEIITLLISFSLFVKFHFTIDFLFSSLVFYILIVLSFIDFKYKAVPDYLLLLVLTLSFFISTSPLTEAFRDGFIICGAFVLLNFILTFYVQHIKARILKDESLKTQEALGEGDIPVLAVFGIVLGLNGAVVAVFLSSILAIIPSLYFKFRKKDIQIPFIPYLSLGFLVEYFFQISKVLN